MEIESETFCPSIGLSVIEGVPKIAKNGEHYIVDFQFKLR